MADLAPQLLAALKGDKGFYPVNGGYDPAQAYRKDTVLRDNGSQWRALQLVPPATPPAEGVYWTKFIDGTPVADAAQVAADRVLSQAAAATSTANMDSVSAATLLVAGSLTAAQLAAQSAVAVSGLANLSAAARAIALDPSVLTAFVYDTRRDSDGGAWVQKANTSINNEPLNTATRGSKAQYPTVMLLVGTATNFTIYDADDPSCPMWAVFNPAGNGGNANIIMTGLISAGLCVSASQGLIALGGTTLCLVTIDLITDTSDRIAAAATVNTGRYLSNLADRNAGKGRDGNLGSVLSGSPITFTSAAFSSVTMRFVQHTLENDARFGLPNPIVILASGAGIITVRPDGSVVNSSSAVAFGRVSFDKNGTLYATAAAANSTVWIYDYPTYISAGFVHAILTNISTPALWGVLPTGPSFVRGSGSRVAVGAATAGLTLINRHRGILANSMVSYIDDWRNTLSLSGATKMACAESLRVLSNLQSTELLTNGSFATDLSGWTNSSIGTGYAAPAWDSGNGGRAALQRIDGTNMARLSWVIPTIAGQIYRVVVAASGANCNVIIRTAAGLIQVGFGGAAAGTSNTIQFRALTTTTDITIYAAVNATTTYVDDISAKAVIGDQSPAGNHLEVFGTLNRSVVAAGAELAAISGFSTSNYAQAPYSASLDPGSGEFSVGCAVVTTGGVTKRVALLDRSAISQTGAYYRLFLNGSGWPSFIISDGTNIAAANATVPLPPGPHRIRGIRRASPARIELEVDGQIVGTTALTTMGSLNNASAVLRLGLFTDGTSPMDATGPGLTAFGVSLTAPSVEQMRAAFADDIQAFPPGAKILLQGGSGVQDIGYDADTDQIYVAKSAGGTDVFQGLVNKGTILSTTSANLIPAAGSAQIWTTAGSALLGNMSVGNDVAGVSAWGRGKLSPFIENNVTAEHYVRTKAFVLPAGTYTMGFLSKAGSRSWGRIWFTGAAQSIFFNTMTGAAGAAVGVTPLPSVDLGGGIWLIQFTFTLASQWTGSPYFYPAISNGNSNYAGDNGASGPAISVGDPIIRSGSTALTVNDFQFAMTRDDNHKLVSAHDGNVLIATAAGADIIMPALPLRSGVRGRRSGALYDADVSKFNGRTTADATPTFIGDPIFVPEGGKVDFLISVTAAVPGGTASELVTTLLKGRAHRNIGDAAATVFFSAVSGSPALPDKTTGTMDATVASMGGGWIGLRVTGKAATLIEWLGRQSLVRAA